MSTRSYALSLAASLFFVTTAGAQEVTLRLGLEPGTRWRVECAQSQVITDAGVPDDERTQDQRQELTLEVSEVLAGGEVRVTLCVDRVRVVQRHHGREVVMDSEDPAGRNGAAAELAGKAIVLKITTRGELVAVERFGDQRLEDMPPPQREFFSRMFGRTLLLDQFLGLVAPLPGRPVGIGATWTVVHELPMTPTATVSIDVTNCVESIDADGVVRITQTGRLRQGAAAAASGLDEATIETTLRFANGMIVGSKGTVRLTRSGAHGGSVTTTIERKRLD